MHDGKPAWPEVKPDYDASDPAIHDRKPQANHGALPRRHLIAVIKAPRRNE